MIENSIKDIGIDITNKAVLVRVDLNVPMEGGVVLDKTRILKIAETVKYLRDMKAKVILISHLGRPDGGMSDSANMSLINVLPALSEILNIDVKFCSSCIGELADAAVENLRSGEVLLMENLRFFPEEETNDETFARGMASLADIYVNEAFSCSHRMHASIVGIPKFLPSYPGLAFQEEISILTNLLDGVDKPNLLIIGGKKVSGKLDALNNLINRFDYVFVAGGMANTFLKASGFDIKNSFYEESMVPMAAAILKENGSKIILPSDFVFQAKDGSVMVGAHIPEGCAIMDVGPETVLSLCALMRDVKSVLWNGPLGLFENPYFDNSTKFVARYIASRTRSLAEFSIAESLTESETREGCEQLKPSKYDDMYIKPLLSIAGGGDTVSAINTSGLASCFSYVSTSGGAFLEFLEGKILPGIQAMA